MQYKYQQIPQTRIATFDVYAVGLLKHHVSALLEFDVTDSRRKLREQRRKGLKASLNAWLIKVISSALEEYREASAYLYNKRKLIMFNDINISMLVEKQIDDKKIPIPLVIERTNEKDISEITREIENAKNTLLSDENIVLNKQSNVYERFYYKLPGFLRIMFWKFFLGHPKIAYKKMGNVAITSLGMMGRINGWFIHKSIHPISFGIGSVIKKPVVIDNEIKIREILNMTILIDHDVIDGAQMVRFLNVLTDYIEGGHKLL